MKHLILLLALAVGLLGQPQSIVDTLTTPQGGTFSGTIVVTLNNPASAQPLYYSTTTLSGWSTTYTITSGAFSATLYANSTITPTGTSYTARYTPSSGSAYSETWVVPVGATTIREIRSTTVPTPSVLFALGQIRQGGATLNQLLSWNGSTWAPTTNVAGNSATATALAANGANCTAGSFPLGVDASGASETCTALPTTIAGTASQITASAATGAVTLSLPSAVSGLTSVAATTFTGALTGNASTATTLQTARTIAGVSFNGSANIAIPSTGLSDTADIVRGGASVAATQVLYGASAGVAGSSSDFAYKTITNTALGSSVVQLGLVDGGLTKIVNTRPTSESKRIVIAGSSVAAGASAATYAQSWAGLFTTAMTAKGYTVFNVSISGNSTQAMINRFYTDIAPLQPDFVIHNTGMPNDGNDFDVYTANTHRLIQMTEGIGAIAVLGSQYAGNDDTATICRQKQDLRAYWQKTGVPFIDFLAATANLSSDCDWYAGTFADALHPNSVGHQLMYSAIQQTMFDVAERKVRDYRAGSGVWEWQTAITGTPLITTLKSATDSWTWSAWVRGKDAAAAAVAMHVGGSLASAGVRIRCTSTYDSWRLSSAAPPFDMSSGVPCGDYSWAHLTAVYNDAIETFTFYVNGVLVGTQTGAPIASAQVFNTFFRSDSGPFIPVGGLISQLAIWRVPLSAEQVKSVYGGQIPSGSLEFHSNFDVATGATLQNLADSSSQTAVDWTTASGWTVRTDVRSFNGVPERYNQFITVDATVNTTITQQTAAYFCNTSSGVITLTLPTTPVYGESHTIRNIGSNNCTIAGNGYNVNGAASATLAAGASATYRYYFGSPRQWFSF